MSEKVDIEAAERPGDTARARELAWRMIQPGPKASHLSASECHELADEVFWLVDELRELRALKSRVDAAPVGKVVVAYNFAAVYAPHELLGKRVRLVVEE
jgi:hypothetical protein